MNRQQYPRKQYARKRYRLEENFALTDTSTMGFWFLEIISPNKLSLATVAQVASGVLCGEYSALEEETIEKLCVFMRIGNEAKKFYFEKGYSILRILDEMSKEIWVS